MSAKSGEPSEIQQTLSVESFAPSLIGALPSITKRVARIQLGWTHYATLLSLDSADMRRFCEIEAAGNGWGVRELKRQVDSALSDRLALSRNSHEVRRLAREGQVVEKASDRIKKPVVLELLGLEEKFAHSESDQSAAIIDYSSSSCWNSARDSHSRRTKTISVSMIVPSRRLGILQPSAGVLCAVRP